MLKQALCFSIIFVSAISIATTSPDEIEKQWQNDLLLLEKNLLVDPDNPKFIIQAVVAYNNLGSYYRSKKQYLKALSYLEKALSLSPNQTKIISSTKEVLILRAQELFQAKDYDQALILVNRGLILTPNDSVLTSLKTEIEKNINFNNNEGSEVVADNDIVDNVDKSTVGNPGNQTTNPSPIPKGSIAVNQSQSDLSKVSDPVNAESKEKSDLFTRKMNSTYFDISFSDTIHNPKLYDFITALETARTEFIKNFGLDIDIKTSIKIIPSTKGITDYVFVQQDDEYVLPMPKNTKEFKFMGIGIQHYVNQIYLKETCPNLYNIFRHSLSLYFLNLQYNLDLANISRQNSYLILPDIKNTPNVLIYSNMRQPIDQNSLNSYYAIYTLGELLIDFKGMLKIKNYFKDCQTDPSIRIDTYLGTTVDNIHKIWVERYLR